MDMFMTLNPLEAIFKPFRGSPDFGTLMHSNIRSALSAIDKVVEQEPKYTQDAVDYRRSLQLIIAKHEYAYKNRKKGPLLSAYDCVVFNDIDTLKCLVWNEKEVNGTDRLGRTALHLAVVREKNEYVAVLLHHPHINLQLKTKPKGLTAQEIAETRPAIKEIFEKKMR
jgi:hypothetical protein